MIINQLTFNNILLDNTVSSKDILYNKVAYGPDGKIIGDAPIDNELYPIATLDISSSVSIDTVNNNNGHLCYVNNNFFKLAYNSGRGMYSEDGFNWKNFYITPNAYLQSMCYGNGKFVAVAEPSNNTYYSEDGINWNYQNTNAPGDSVCYGNGKFVSVSSASYCSTAYSEDGINWTPSKNLSESSWYSVCYGNGKFVAITRSDNIAAYSEDGINWTEVELPALDQHSYRVSMCYGNNKFVAVIQNSNKFIYSEDGINWNQIELSKSAYWYSIIYANDKFVAISGSYMASYSEDGINWNIVGTMPSTSLLGYGNDKFIAMNPSGKKLMYSLDGMKWYYTLNEEYYKFINTPIEIVSKDNYHGILKAYDIPFLQWNDITTVGYLSYDKTLVYYADGKFIAMGTNTGVASYSEDAINWMEVSLSSSGGYWSCICYGGGKFVALSSRSNINEMVSSENGIVWEKSTMPQGLSWYSVAYGNGIFVAIASSSNVAAYSTDGINWTQTTLPVSGSWYSVCYGNGKFVAIVYNSNVAAYSTDGINWTQFAMPTSAQWQSICYGGGKFVVVSNYNNIGAYSEDGINWTQTTFPTLSSRVSIICYADDKFVSIYGSNYGSSTVSTSTDGINWTSNKSMSSNYFWNSICYGKGKLVASIYKSNKAVYAYSKKYEIEMLN